jgi:16S rRNA (guanine527-N7)-methyltransferase
MICPEFEAALLEMNIIISDTCVHSIELFAAELKKWNKKVNLTALCKDSDIAIKHMIDSLVLASCINSGNIVMDIGSGAGFPAIPIKIVKPETRVISVDAVGKKIMFQRHVGRLLGLDRFEALHARIESLHSTYTGFFDVITSRAFSQLDMFVSLAAPMLKSDGRMIAMKGPDVEAEIDNARDKLRLLGFEVRSVQNYSLPMNKGNRSLVTITAVNAHK